MRKQESKISETEVKALAGDPLQSKARKKVNINAISRVSSGRLATTVTANIADEILRERGRNGDFKDLNDLKNRTSGVGAVNCQKLKDAGFVAEPRGKDLKRKDEGVEEEKDGGGDGEMSWNPHLRLDVAHLKDQTFRHRHGADLYTKMTKHYFEKNNVKVENDHVLEDQLTTLCNQRVGEAGGIAYRTRGTQTLLQEMFNNVSNLNVTSHYVNQKKKGPF